ncbi:MAG: hypothetical protein ACM3NQ_21990 [Bacteroidales bacterium]
MFVLQRLMLACLVALGGQSGPPSAPKKPPPDAQQVEAVVGPDRISLEKIRKALQRETWGDGAIFPVGLPPLPPPPPNLEISPESVATFRTHIIGLMPKSFEEDLKEALAVPVASANAGFFDVQPPGWHRAGAGPGLGVSGGGGAYVHPSALVDWAPRLIRKRAVSKARQQVEAELQALIAAQQKATAKPNR